MNGAQMNQIAPAVRDMRETLLDMSRQEEVQRWASLATATAAIAYGISRRSVPGLCLAAAATPLAYLGVMGEWPRVMSEQPQDTRAALGGARGILVHEAMRIEKPLDEVFRFWRQLDNLPRVMTYLESITDLGGGRSHWIAKGPAGVKVQWDAELVNEVANKVIAWRSLPGADVITAGSVNFDSVRGGRTTEVSVRLQYAPPAGSAGSWLATIFGREPAQTIREDLRHVKQILEAGEIPRATPAIG
jgi:uncharacterized membrane protein